ATTVRARPCARRPRRAGSIATAAAARRTRSAAPRIAWAPGRRTARTAATDLGTLHVACLERTVIAVALGREEHRGRGASDDDDADRGPEPPSRQKPGRLLQLEIERAFVAERDVELHLVVDVAARARDDLV